MWPIPQFSADLDTFNEEIFNRKLHFLQCKNSSLAIFEKGNIDIWDGSEYTTGSELTHLFKFVSVFDKHIYWIHCVIFKSRLFCTTNFSEFEILMSPFFPNV